MEIDIQIKGMLPYTWNAFFSSFGKLREIQRKTIPLVLNHENLVVSSPAATGKTEAVVAPIVELWMKSRDVLQYAPTGGTNSTRADGLYAVYVSPTRALVNDLYKRLLPPLEMLDIPMGRRTGDRHAFNLKNPEPLLITTPESLDSLIARYPKIFESVKVVVLDEVHLLHDSYRGDQVRVLLKRLSLLSRGESPTRPYINFYALSATIGDPLKIGNYYLPADFKIVTAPEKLEIEYHLFEIEYGRELLADEFRKREVRKALIFVNSREEAERVVKRFQFPPFNNRVWVHHGSMSKPEREEIEGLMNSPGLGICVATSTLEFGIDIGDIDAVVLFGPPPDVSSLLQRIGRGCRRKNNHLLAYGIYSTIFERLLFYTLFEDAKAGNLTRKARVFDPSVACQQIFSYLYQKRGVGTSLNAIKRLLGEVMRDGDIEKIVETLVEKEVIEAGKSNLYFLTHKLGKLVELGKIHSNIQDKKELEIIDARTNKRVGVIQKPLPRFNLGGIRWTATSIEEDRLYVTPLQHIQGVVNKGYPLVSGKVFCGKGSFWWDWNRGKRLKNEIFNESNVGIYSNIQGVGVPSCRDANVFPYFTDGERTFFFHFAGPVYGTLWQKVLNEKGIEVEDVGDFLFVSNKQLEPDRFIFTDDEIMKEAYNLAFQLKYYLDFGAFFNFLPQDMKKEAIVSSIELKEFTAHIQNSHFNSIPIELGQKVIASLIK